MVQVRYLGFFSPLLAVLLPLAHEHLRKIMRLQRGKTEGERMGRKEEEKERTIFCPD
jgi:hypothetical protein